MQTSAINFPQNSQSFQNGSLESIYLPSTADFDRGQSWLFSGQGQNNPTNLANGHSNVIYNALHYQGPNGETPYMAHHEQLLFRVIDPSSTDTNSFIAQRNKLLQSTKERQELVYFKSKLPQLRGHPLAFLFTLPQLNYELTIKQLVDGACYDSVEYLYNMIRFVGDCITPYHTSRVTDNGLYDSRVITTAGPARTRNVFGKHIEENWDVYILYKPVPCTDNTVERFRLVPDGGVNKVEAKSDLGNGNKNKNIQNGYYWRLEYFCQPNAPTVADVSYINMDKDIFVTGIAAKVGRINHLYIESHNAEKALWGLNQPQGEYGPISNDQHLAHIVNPISVFIQPCDLPMLFS